ncbi:hypothetical protein [Aeromonas sp. MdU4]|uniref:hypothetical protein n=1 Tax=Aeromonas sp. MdU4 TaxID=3342819 RepID=UPI0035BAC4B6
MRFQQIKELLHYLELVHHQLGLCYRRLGDQVDSERCRMLLVYLQGREDAASAHLQEYASQLGESVRETWLDQCFSEDMLPDIARCELSASARTEEIVALVCRWEEQLIGELGHLARECPTPATAALLDNLARLEQTRLTQLVHGAHRLDDL